MSNTNLKIIFIFSLTIVILVAMIIIKYIMLAQVSATIAIVETQAPVIHTIDKIIITGDSGVSDIGTQVIIINKPNKLTVKPNVKVEPVNEEPNVFVESQIVKEDPVVVTQPVIVAEPKVDGYSSKLGY